MAQIYLSLGSNLGNRVEILENAQNLIEKRIGTITKTSSYYESEPWGFESDNPFINQIICIDSDIKPQDLLFTTQSIEKKLGRKQKTRIHARSKQKQYCSRTIDIDIIFYGKMIFNHSELMIPHPEMHNRRFVLEPLAEIANQFLHPIFQQSIDELLTNCSDQCGIQVLEPEPVGLQF